MSKMLTDTTKLQQALYRLWKRKSGPHSSNPDCRFCGFVNDELLREYHFENCPRLDYLRIFYDVTPDDCLENRQKVMEIRGFEDSRAGRWVE